MKKLLKVNYKIWSAILLVIVSSAATLAVVLNMKIEKTYSMKLQVDDSSVSTLIVKDQGAYLLKPGDDITIQLQSQTISSKIKNIAYDKDDKEYKIELFDIGKQLVPNTTLDAKIIYDSHSVFDALLHPGV